MSTDRESFLKQLTASFPEFERELDEYSIGLLHCEVAAFRRLTEKAMDDGRAWQAEQHFKFVAVMLASADTALDNALWVSYLIDLALGEQTPHRYQIVKGRMPRELRKQMIQASNFWK